MSLHRRVSVGGAIKIKDDETGTDEYGYYRAGGFAIVGPDLPSRELEKGSKCVGGEVRFEIDLEVSYIENGNVRISGEARLYEGTSCRTMEMEDSNPIEVLVPRGGTDYIRIYLSNREPGGGDYSRGTLTVYNSDQPEGHALPTYANPES